MELGPRPDDGVGDLRARHHDACRNDRIDRGSHTTRAGVDEFRGCEGRSRFRKYRPRGVVQIEDRVDRDEIHVCFVESIERSDVSPVVAVAVRRTRHVVANEVVDSRVVEVHEVGHDVAPHVVV